MFDLFRSRDKAVRILLTVILGLVTLSMVGYLIPNYGGSGSTPNDNVVAEIGNTKLTIRDVQSAIRAATRNREMPPGMMQHYIPQIIEQMITEKALIYQAGKMGFVVNEADTAKAIREQMPQLALELTDIVLNARPLHPAGRQVKARALRLLATRTPNRVERNLYLVEAKAASRWLPPIAKGEPAKRP